MAKKKSKLKKFLKRALPVAALAAGAGLLARRRRNQANVEMDLPMSNLGSFADARAKMTTNDAMRGKSSVYKDAIMRGGGGARIPDNLPITSANVQRNLVDPPLKGFIDRNRRVNFGLDDYASFKKGGRVGCGIAKKGFGKAMKRRKK